MSNDAMFGCCDVCGEFECDVDYDVDDSDDYDDDWLFDASGMVGDD